MNLFQRPLRQLALRAPPASSALCAGGVTGPTSLTPQKINLNPPPPLPKPLMTEA